MKGIREIAITDMPEVSIGNVQSDEAKTGVTVLLFDKKGAVVGVDISGGGPASRETPLTSPVTADNPINAIVLSGGSAYGLAAADGVMRCLEDHGIGFETGYARVPLVCQSCIYDLGYGSATVRPDSAMGYAACEKALAGGNPSCGSVGAGTGATVGKICGMERAMKSGLGMYAVELGELRMAAVVAVNALGDIFDPSTGQKIAGLLTADEQDRIHDKKCLCTVHQPCRNHGRRRQYLRGIRRRCGSGSECCGNPGSICDGTGDCGSNPVIFHETFFVSEGHRKPGPYRTNLCAQQRFGVSRSVMSGTE